MPIMIYPQDQLNLMGTEIDFQMILDRVHLLRLLLLFAINFAIKDDFSDVLTHH